MGQTILEQAHTLSAAKRFRDSKGSFTSPHLQLPKEKRHSPSPLIPPTLQSSPAPASLSGTSAQHIPPTSKTPLACCSLPSSHPARKVIPKRPSSSQPLRRCLRRQPTSLSCARNRFIHQRGLLACLSNLFSEPWLIVPDTGMLKKHNEGLFHSEGLAHLWLLHNSGPTRRQKS